MTDLEWINRYVGARHVTNGRGPDGYDCWGLMLAVWREQRGIELPDFQAPNDSTFVEAVEAVGKFYKEWPTVAPAVQVEEGQEWDFVAVIRRRQALHMGLVINRGVLHSSYPAGAVWQSALAFNQLHPHREYWRWLG